MELWIRSQDKLFLGKIDKLLINGYDIFSQDQLIGTYSTYKRSLEVLDEIYDLLQNAYTGCSNRIVYQMPKE